MVSVVIPAHNEELVIGRCLASLLDDARPGEFDVVVVTNGCRDRTAEVAASFPGVRVVDSPVASKPAALSLGDRHAKRFPRVYLDADVEVGAPAVRAVADALTDGRHHLGAPRLQPQLAGRPWAVRAYYDVWTSLPYVRDRHVGSGFYALSEQGRARFADFPDTMAEDFFVYSLATEDERITLADHHFVTHPPYSLRSLVKIQTRMLAANARHRELFADAADQVLDNQRAELTRLARRPAYTPKVAVYVAVRGLARVAARRRVRAGRDGSWDRDHTARARAGA